MTPQALPLLGCIADDFTGASDLANTLATSGHEYRAVRRAAGARGPCRMASRRDLPEKPLHPG